MQVLIQINFQLTILCLYSASSLIRSLLIWFLANPASFIQEVDLFTLAFKYHFTSKKFSILVL